MLKKQKLFENSSIWCILHLKAHSQSTVAIFPNFLTTQWPFLMILIQKNFQFCPFFVVSIASIANVNCESPQVNEKMINKQELFENSSIYIWAH